MALADDQHDEPPGGPPAPAPGTVAVADYAALLSSAEAVLDDVETALRRLDQGTYGRCEVCDAAIDDDRLSSLPTAATCRTHATAGPAVAGRPDAG